MKNLKSYQKRLTLMALTIVSFTVIMASDTQAHFAALLPSHNIVSNSQNNTLTIQAKFLHPFGGQYMQMDKPVTFGIFVRGNKTDLSKNLSEKKAGAYSYWETTYKVKSPGDHIIYLEPSPYWEPAEEKFIIHYTKVIINAFDMQVGWDANIGLPTEIIPLTRPYGLWTGNVFQGQVLNNGKPDAGATVEVEYLNSEAKLQAPSSAYVTQVIKADKNGIFTYAMPKAGWWGFAALSEADYKLDHNGRQYPVETGAVIWVQTKDMK